MTTFRYTASQTWYKGNTHIHSTASDGGWTFHELATAYAGAGYDFLFRTDHWAASDVAGDTVSYPLLWLDGIELDGFDTESGFYHLVCLGTFKGIARSMGFPAAVGAAREQGGFVILAHPFWTGNSFADALRWRFHGVEIYNHVCQWLNGKGAALAYWQAMLRESTGVVGIACDDAHIRPEHPGWDGGWVMIQAPALTREDVMVTLRTGRFYSSMGPSFHQIVGEEARVHIKTSPVRFMRLVGPAYLGQRVGSFEGPLITEASFEVSPDWPYAYLEIEDGRGRRAWTNTLWMR